MITLMTAYLAGYGLVRGLQLARRLIAGGV